MPRAFWKAVVPPVTRRELQASSPLFLGVAQGVAAQVTLDEVVASAWTAVPKPARTRAAVTAVAEPTRCHLRRMWGKSVRKVQPPDGEGQGRCGCVPSVRFPRRRAAACDTVHLVPYATTENGLNSDLRH